MGEEQISNSELLQEIAERELLQQRKLDDLEQYVRSNLSSSKRTVGEMNGKWAWLLKVQLATVPPVLVAVMSLVTWVVVQQFYDINFRMSSERFSQADGRELDERTRNREDKIVHLLTSKLENLDGRISSVERTTDRILVLLEKQQTK